MARPYGRLIGIAAILTLLTFVLLSLSPLARSPSARTFAAQQEQPKQSQAQTPAVVDHPEEHEPDAQEQKLAEIATALKDGPVYATPTTEDTESMQTQNATSTRESAVTESSATPTPTQLSKIIVMGKLSKEDTDWVQQEMSDWQNAIYYVDLPQNETSPSGLKTPFNKAKESTPYLTYIIDHYPDFPDVIVFIHSHRNGMPQAWHNDAAGKDAVNMLHDLRLETVLDRGYVNLRCITEVGCPAEVQPFRDPPDPEKHAEHAFPYVYANFFNASFNQMQELIPIVATPCCAQYALSRAQILEKPKYEYERYRNFIEETHYDDDTSGRVMEYMWHIIFGRDAVHCDNLYQCWCEVYGRCARRGNTFYGGWGV